MSNHRRRCLVGALIAAGLVLGGCTSGLSTEPQSGDAADRSAAEEAGPDADESGGAAAGERSERSDGSETVARGEIRDRSIIRIGRMTVRVKDIRVAVGRATALVGGTEGYVESEQSTADEDGDLASAQVVLRVEADDYQRVAGGLRKLGKVLSDKSDTTDVTEEIVDVESRIESQEQSLERMRNLMAAAETVGEVIKVESELSTRQAELESLQSRYAVLTSQTSLSTITVDFERPDKDSEESPDDQSGFFWGLGRGWNALLEAGTVLLTVVGAVLPFATVVAVIFVPLWLLLRGRIRRRTQPTPPEPAPSG